MQNTTTKTFITENVVGTHIGRLKEIAAKSDKLNYDNELHGKVYLFYEGDIPTGFIIGSSNFTDKGLEKNKQFSQKWWLYDIKTMALADDFTENKVSATDFVNARIKEKLK